MVSTRGHLSPLVEAPAIARQGAMQAILVSAYRIAPWVISAGVHATALAAVASLALSLGVDRPPPLVLMQGITQDEAEMQRLDMPAQEPLPAAIFQYVGQPDATRDLLAPERWYDPHDWEASGTPLPGPRGAVREVTALVDQLEQSAEWLDREYGARARFFDVPAAGHTFVFVVDCSLSMHGKKWHRVRRELVECVARLAEDQCFYVILFDELAHPMFGSYSPEPRPVVAHESNVARLEEWLNRAELASGTKPCGAMKLAMTLDPDAIYLLSDGEFHDPTAAYLRGVNRQVDASGSLVPRVPVHAIGIESWEAESVLRGIAADNGGTFRHVR